MNAFERLFAVFYEWNLKRWHHDVDIATKFAAIAVALGWWVNIAVLVVMSARHFPVVPSPKLAAWSIVIVTYGISYSLFVRGGRHKRILEEYRALPDQERRRAFVGAWGYMFVSYVLLLFAVWVG
jgi:hypothetical protein